MILLRSLLLLLSIQTLVVEGAGARRCATVFRNANYKGSYRIIWSGESIINLKDIGWNDEISSLTVNDGCVLSAYVDNNYNGFNANFYAVDNPAVDNNDAYSSLKCDCTRGGCATVYVDNNYMGSSWKIDPDESIIDLRNQGWNNKISSLTVNDGCVLTAFEHENYSGFSWLFSADKKQVDYNDCFSSLKCYCTKDAKCPETNSFCSKGDCKCGQAAKRKLRIVGGQGAEVNEYPWQVGIVWKNQNTVRCGGSLISNQWILTAAHCVHPISLAFKSQVLLGEHDYLSSDETTVIRMDIVRIWENGYYKNNPKSHDYDFSLLKMETAIRFADYPHIRPICLPEDNSKDYNGLSAIVTGWGDTAFGGSQSNELREVDVEVMTNNECKNDYGNNVITDRMMCAEAKGGNGGKDSCQGDSGGPLVTSTGDGQNYELIGVVSFGDGCARAGKPGVYARVTSVLSWIKFYGEVLGNTCPRT